MIACNTSPTTTSSWNRQANRSAFCTGWHHLIVGQENQQQRLVTVSEINTWGTDWFLPGDCMKCNSNWCFSWYHRFCVWPNHAWGRNVISFSLICLQTWRFSSWAFECIGNILHEKLLLCLCNLRCYKSKLNIRLLNFFFTVFKLLTKNEHIRSLGKDIKIVFHPYSARTEMLPSKICGMQDISVTYSYLPQLVLKSLFIKIQLHILRAVIWILLCLLSFGKMILELRNLDSLLDFQTVFVGALHFPDISFVVVSLLR